MGFLPGMQLPCWKSSLVNTFGMYPTQNDIVFHLYQKTYPGGTFTCLRAAVSHSTPFDFFSKLLYQLIIFFSAAWSFRGINFRLSHPFQGKYKDIRWLVIGMTCLLSNKLSHFSWLPSFIYLSIVLYKFFLIMISLFSFGACYSSLPWYLYCIIVDMHLHVYLYIHAKALVQLHFKY